MRVVDVLLAFPGILLAIALTAILGPNLRNVVLALCVMGWVGYARKSSCMIELQAGHCSLLFYGCRQFSQPCKASVRIGAECSIGAAPCGMING